MASSENIYLMLVCLLSAFFLLFVCKIQKINFSWEFLKRWRSLKKLIFFFFSFLVTSFWHRCYWIRESEKFFFVVYELYLENNGKLPKNKFGWKHSQFLS
jgi:hypothetical protein